MTSSEKTCPGCDGCRPGPDLVQCVVCYQSKAPRGRSSSPESRHCEHECPGRYEDPQIPSALWPGEDPCPEYYPCRANTTGAERQGRET